jgi:hypothetical protein
MGIIPCVLVVLITHAVMPVHLYAVFDAKNEIATGTTRALQLQLVTVAGRYLFRPTCVPPTGRLGNCVVPRIQYSDQEPFDSLVPCTPFLSVCYHLPKDTLARINV